MSKNYRRELGNSYDRRDRPDSSFVSYGYKQKQNRPNFQDKNRPRNSYSEKDSKNQDHVYEQSNKEIPPKKAKVDGGKAWCKVCSEFYVGDDSLHVRTYVHQKKLSSSGNKKLPETVAPLQLPTPEEMLLASTENVIKEKVLVSENHVSKPNFNEVPKFDESTSFATGPMHIIHVTGYFCVLCHKFYASEKRMYDDHCRSRDHYDQYVKFLKEEKVRMPSKSPPKEAASHAVESDEEFINVQCGQVVKDKIQASVEMPSAPAAKKPENRPTGGQSKSSAGTSLSNRPMNRPHLKNAYFRRN